MKTKNILKYVFGFIIHYVTYTAVLWLLNEDKKIGSLLIDGLIITFLFEFVEMVSASIKKKSRRESDGNAEQPEPTKSAEETAVTWIVGICFVLLIALRILSILI